MRPRQCDFFFYFLHSGFQAGLGVKIVTRESRCDLQLFNRRFGLAIQVIIFRQRLVGLETITGFAGGGGQNSKKRSRTLLGRDQ